MATEVIIPFTFNAAEVNAFDATGSGVNDVGGALPGMATNSIAVRIPTRLELVKAAGTAYTITTTISGGYGRDKAPFAVNNSAAELAGGAYLELYEGDSNYFNRVWFRIPLLGFLNSASQQIRVAFPLIDGAVLGPGANSWKIRSTVPIASGTGSLTGRLYLDDHFVTV